MVGISGLTTKEEPVPGPGTQEYVTPPVAVSVVVESPTHIVEYVAEVVTTGREATVTPNVAVLAHDAELTVTLYVVLDVGETGMEEVVAPVLQEYE